MSSHIPVQLREQVLARAKGRCAYCWSSEDLMGVTFEFDHMVPKSAGGETNFDNLCLSCPTCNRYKAARLTALDPLTGDEVSIFHPNKQIWEEHFTWGEDGAQIVGLSTIGRTTAKVLRMNRSVMVRLRRYWVVLGLHPPRK